MNEVKSIIVNGDAICFVIQTDGEKDFWWWEISGGEWNKYWKGGTEINKKLANIFVNDMKTSSYGCICSSFTTIEDAKKNYMEE